MTTYLMWCKEYSRVGNITRLAIDLSPCPEGSATVMVLGDAAHPKSDFEAMGFYIPKDRPPVLYVYARSFAKANRGLTEHKRKLYPEGYELALMQTEAETFWEYVDSVQASKKACASEQ